MCVFCKIINGEIPSKKIYEDNDVLAILDLSQIGKGHTLVLPKAHYENILDIPNDIYSKVMEKAKYLANVINKTYNPDGLNILNNCKEAAGQSVMHFHVHIIPRYDSDNFDIGWPQGEPDSAEQAELAEKLAARL
jgi:histidine triad (HIT) family protein